MILHLLDQGINGLLPEWIVVAGRAGSKRIRLIDEQNAIQRRGNPRLGFQCRLADVTGDKSGPIRLDQMAVLQHPEITQDRTIKAGDDGLANARRSSEDHVQRNRRDRQPLVAPRRFNFQALYQGADLGLHRIQAGHACQCIECVNSGTTGIRAGGAQSGA